MNPRASQIDDCRTRAMRMMQTPLGLEAAESGFYTEMFLWLFHELERGRTPAGIPAKLLEGWRGRSGG